MASVVQCNSDLIPISISRSTQQKPKCQNVEWWGEFTSSKLIFLKWFNIYFVSSYWSFNLATTDKNSPCSAPHCDFPVITGSWITGFTDVRGQMDFNFVFNYTITKPIMRENTLKLIVSQNKFLRKAFQSLIKIKWKEHRIKLL